LKKKTKKWAYLWRILVYLLVATWRIFGESFQALMLRQRYTKDTPKIHHKNTKLQLEDTPKIRQRFASATWCIF
jgi:hypothetical protein